MQGRATQAGRVRQGEVGRQGMAGQGKAER
jgi:hypothetical protein